MSCQTRRIRRDRSNNETSMFGYWRVNGFTGLKLDMARSGIFSSGCNEQRNEIWKGFGAAIGPGPMPRPDNPAVAWTWIHICPHHTSAQHLLQVGGMYVP